MDYLPIHLLRDILATSKFWQFWKITVLNAPVQVFVGLNFQLFKVDTKEQVFPGGCC